MLSYRLSSCRNVNAMLVALENSPTVACFSQFVNGFAQQIAHNIVTYGLPIH